MPFVYPLFEKVTFIQVVAMLSILSLNFGAQFTNDSTMPTAQAAPINSVAFSSDLSFFATGANENTAKAWNYNTQLLLASLPYIAAVTNVNINPSNNFIYISISNGTVSIVDPSTFTQSTSYLYPNSGYSNIIIFQPLNSIYYLAGYDPTFAPFVYVYDSTSNIQSSNFATSFNTGQKIISMDLLYDSVNNYNLLALVSDQGVGPFRMAIFNMNLAFEMDFDEATGQMNSVKFSPSGLYVYSTSTDNIIRMYKLDTSRGLAYVYLTQYDTTAYGGFPSFITTPSDYSVNVAVDKQILTFKIVSDQIIFVDVFIASATSDISCMKKVNSVTYVGFNDGSVNLLKSVILTSTSDSSNTTGLIIGVVIGTFFGMLIICLIIWFFFIRKRNKQDQIQQNDQNYMNQTNQMSQFNNINTKTNDKLNYSPRKSRPNITSQLFMINSNGNNNNSYPHSLQQLQIEQKVNKSSSKKIQITSFDTIQTSNSNVYANGNTNTNENIKINVNEFENSYENVNVADYNEINDGYNENYGVSKLSKRSGSNGNIDSTSMNFKREQRQKQKQNANANANINMNMPKQVQQLTVINLE